MDIVNSANDILSELEESRIKSKPSRTFQHSLSQAMAEALYQPNNIAQPKPLASRVKNAGKEFLRHNQTCQWIQFMQEPLSPVQKRKEKRSTKVNAEPELNNVNNESDIGSLPVILDVDQPPLMEPSPPSYEEQLRNLQKQQEELLEQQRHLEEQMEQQKKTRSQKSLIETPTKAVLSETSEMKETVPACPPKHCQDGKETSNCPPSRFRRRLKGCIALSFAERDEGSIGSLLYNTTAQECPTEKRSSISNSSYASYSRSNQEGRQYARSNESSSSISQLLSQLPSSSSIEVMKHSSHSLATITDTTTDVSVKERKDGDY